MREILQPHPRLVRPEIGGSVCPDMITAFDSTGEHWTWMPCKLPVLMQLKSRR